MRLPVEYFALVSSPVPPRQGSAPVRLAVAGRRRRSHLRLCHRTPFLPITTIGPAGVFAERRLRLRPNPGRLLPVPGRRRPLELIPHRMVRHAALDRLPSALRVRAVPFAVRHEIARKLADMGIGGCPELGRRPSVTVPRVRVRACRKQQRDRGPLGFPGHRRPQHGPMQRRPPDIVSRVHVRPGRKESLHRPRQVPRCAPDQRGPRLRIPAIRIGPAFGQANDLRRLAPLGRPHQRPIGIDHRPHGTEDLGNLHIADPVRPHVRRGPRCQIQRLARSLRRCPTARRLDGFALLPSQPGHVRPP